MERRLALEVWNIANTFAADANLTQRCAAAIKKRCKYLPIEDWVSTLMTMITNFAAGLGEKKKKNEFEKKSH
jgi:hypothetical protein